MDACEPLTPLFSSRLGPQPWGHASHIQGVFFPFSQTSKSLFTAPGQVSWVTLDPIKLAIKINCWSVYQMLSMESCRPLALLEQPKKCAFQREEELDQDGLLGLFHGH